MGVAVILLPLMFWWPVQGQLYVYLLCSRNSNQLSPDH